MFVVNTTLINICKWMGKRVFQMNSDTKEKYLFNKHDTLGMNLTDLFLIFRWEPCITCLVSSNLDVSLITSRGVFRGHDVPCGRRSTTCQAEASDYCRRRVSVMRFSRKIKNSRTYTMAAKVSRMILTNLVYVIFC